MQRFRKILFVTDGLGETGSLIARVERLAESNQAHLTILDCVNGIPSGIGLPFRDSIYAEAETVVLKERNSLFEEYSTRHKLGKKVGYKAVTGTPYLQVLKELEAGDYDLVIKCPEDPDWLDRIFGSNDMQLLRKCPCPLWLIPESATSSYKNVLVAINVSDQQMPDAGEVDFLLNCKLAELGASLAVSEGAELHFVYVWESVMDMASGLVFSPDASEGELANDIEREVRRNRSLVDTFLRKAKKESRTLGESLDYVSPVIHVRRGIAARDIPELVSGLEIDCLIMGTVARTGIPGLFIGNTAETILEQIKCSVVTVKPNSD